MTKEALAEAIYKAFEKQAAEAEQSDYVSCGLGMDCVTLDGHFDFFELAADVLAGEIERR